MTVSVRPLSGGRLDALASFFFVDAAPDAPISVPVACYLVTHPRGRLVFDTGLHADAALDPVGRLGARRAARFRIGSAPGDHVVASLARAGVEADDVTHVFNSHLHFDHCGCNTCFGRARVLVQRSEFEATRAAREAGGDDPGDWADPSADVLLLDGEHDVFGDGTVVALPTPGHTPGHQSLRVRTGSGRVLVLVGDACYTARHVDESMPPPAGAIWDAAALADSATRLRSMRDRHGAMLLYSHDETQWQALSRAPGGID
jgi:N-acyl homoserine lactone hydrolase